MHFLHFHFGIFYSSFLNCKICFLTAMWNRLLKASVSGLGRHQWYWFCFVVGFFLVCFLGLSDFTTSRLQCYIKKKTTDSINLFCLWFFFPFGKPGLQMWKYPDGQGSRGVEYQQYKVNFNRTWGSSTLLIIRLNISLIYVKLDCFFIWPVSQMKLPLHN